MSFDPAVDVQIACDDDGIPDVTDIRAWVQRALAESGAPPGVEVSVRVVDKKEIRALNRDYRHRDEVTNVLAFPADAIAGLPPGEVRLLGDVVVCAAVVAGEAGAQGKPVREHWAHMLVHGTLHLVGFDHQHESEAAAMEALERRILGRYGLPDPYGESA